MKLYFIRHANPDYALDALTEPGHAQAALLPERFKREGITDIYASPQGRARQTAKYVADALGLGITTLAWLRELTWGSSTGNPYDSGNPWHAAADMLESGRVIAEDTWRDDPGFVDNVVVEDCAARAKALDAFLAERGYTRFGDSYVVGERVSDESAALFCHGGLLSAVFSHFTGMPFPRVCAQIVFPQTSVSVVEFAHSSNGSRVLPKYLCVGDVAHLNVMTGVTP